jgi:hypothetical protein
MVQRQDDQGDDQQRAGARSHPEEVFAIRLHPEEN